MTWRGPITAQRWRSWGWSRSSFQEELARSPAAKPLAYLAHPKQAAAEQARPAWERALPMTMMNVVRLAFGLASIAVLPATAPASAQTYPSRPVTLITPFAAGSVTDATARAIAQHLQDALGQSFVVENRAGAGGLLAANAVARAAPDGHTLLITTNSTHSAAPGLFKSVPYDPIKDFTPVARIGSFPSLIAVHPDQPIH